MIKESCDFKDGSLSLSVLPSWVFVGLQQVESGDIMYLICHVTLHDHHIESGSEFMGVNSFCYVDKSCEHKHSDAGDMFLICHVIFCEHIFKWLCEFMGGSPSR